MHNFGTFLLWALAGFTLWHGCMAENYESDFVCLIDDSVDYLVDNQCDTFCLQEVEAKVESQLLRVETNLKGHLQKAQAQLEEQLLAVQTMLEESQAKLEQILLAVQTGLNNQLQEDPRKLEKPNQLQAVPAQPAKMRDSDSDRNIIQLQKYNHPQAVPNKEKQFQQAARMKDSDSDRNTIPSGFQKVGNRYYRIISGPKNRETAEIRCKELAGEKARFLPDTEGFHILSILTRCSSFSYIDGLWKDKCTGRLYFPCEWDPKPSTSSIK